MNNSTNNSSLLGVVSGKDSLKFEVSVNVTTIALLVVGVFVAVLGAVIIAKKVS